MATEPRLPPDEAPLDAHSIDLFLSNMGSEMVLVGGQALAFWMDRFDLRADGAVISNDGDALGKVARAHDIARAIQARLVQPDPSARTALVAQLRLPVTGGKERNIDILHLLYTVGGLKKSTAFTQKVIQDSVKVEWREGKFIRVMDPFDVLDSRVQNAAGLLDEKGPHVLTQASWAIDVARAALLKLAAAPQSTERLGQRIQGIYTLAHSQAGRRLLKDHGIEVLAAIDTGALQAASAAHARQLDKVRVAQAQRQPSRPVQPD
jgi:hypothetical protein